MGSDVAIGKGIVAEILARANGARDEVCGLLVGAPGRVTGVLHCTNVAADPAMAFEIDPGQLIAAHRHARRGGPAVVGCYHSHPSGAPVPSPRDAAGAGMTEWLWLIAASQDVGVYRVRQGGPWHGIFEPVRYTDGVS